MTPERMGVCALFVLGAGVLFYYAQSQTSDKIVVPEIESQMQFAGLNVNGNLSYNPGTMLDIGASGHLWEPKTNPRDFTNAPTVKTRCRYPTVPGGNISSVMHKGWGGFLGSAPDNDWFFNPPEAAVL